MITKILNRIDFALLITILIALISVWMYFYNAILDYTDIAKFELAFGLSICHYLLTCYIIIGLFICYFKGRSMLFETCGSSSLTKWQMIKDKLIFLFLDSWIYLFIFSIVIITIGQLIISDDLFMILYLFVILFIFVLLVLKYTKRLCYIYRIIISSIVSNILLYLLFLFFMIISSMQLKFETNKDFYTIDDKFIIVKVVTRGYIYKPYYALKCRNDHNFPSAINGFCDCFKISTNNIEKSIETTIPVVYYNSFLHKYIKIEKQTRIKVYLSPPNDNYYFNVRFQYSR